MSKYDVLIGIMVTIVASFSVAGCASTKVERVAVEKPVDFSGRWNDTDSRLTANTVITDALGRTWVDDFREQNGRKPVVIVGIIKNQTEEHINVDVFMKNLERALIDSGKVKFVAAKDERRGVREERVAQNQEGFTNPETITPMGQETGADFMLIGSVNSLKDETSGRYVILYQVNTEMVDLRTNEKVWIGQNHLKKIVTKSKYSL
ncbi:MAG TPA: penicillin-binding protein activator LpoB [Candidatus Bathyarchaeia archaeon]|nr:penicillin-binding protein activator LpoB [Candidatus Bathyarchaeia archaeon]